LDSFGGGGDRGHAAKETNKERGADNGLLESPEEANSLAGSLKRKTGFLVTPVMLAERGKMTRRKKKKNQTPGGWQKRDLSRQDQNERTLGLVRKLGEAKKVKKNGDTSDTNKGGGKQKRQHTVHLSEEKKWREGNRGGQ